LASRRASRLRWNATEPALGNGLSLVIPAFLVAILTFVLSLNSMNTLTETAHEEQLRFVRSTCISVAVLALGWAGEYIATASGSLFIFDGY